MALRMAVCGRVYVHDAMEDIDGHKVSNISTGLLRCDVVVKLTLLLSFLHPLLTVLNAECHAASFGDGKTLVKAVK